MLVYAFSPEAGTMSRLRLPLVLISIALTISSSSPRLPRTHARPPHSRSTCGAALSDATDGRSVPTPSPASLYYTSCPFHCNA